MIRKNLVTNPKAKSDTSGWENDPTYLLTSLTRVSNWSAEGISAPQVNGATVTTGFKGVPDTYVWGSGGKARTTVELPVGSFSMSAYMYFPEKYASVSADIWETSARTSEPMYVSRSAQYDDDVGQWVRYTLSGYNGNASNVVDLTIYIYSTATADPPAAYWTCAMIEADGEINDYADGDTDGWEWNEDGTSTATAEVSRIPQATLATTSITDLAATGNAVMEEYVARRGYPLDLKNPTEGQVVALKNMFV